MEERTNLGPSPRQISFPQQVHLSDYVDTLRRRKRIVILFTLALLMLVILYASFTTPVYKASAQILLESHPLASISSRDSSSSDPRAQQDFYMTQYNLLQSRSLAYRVINELGLGKEIQAKPPLIRKIESRLSPFLASFRELVQSPLKSLPENVNQMDSVSTVSMDPIVVDWYLANLEITPVRNTQLVTVSFYGASPELLPRIVTTHAKAFVETNSQTHKTRAEKASHWIETQLQDQKKRLEESQRALYQYKKKNSIISLEGRENIVSQKLTDLNSALTQARYERLSKEAAYKQLENFSVNKETFLALPEIQRNAVIQNLRAKLVAVRTQSLEMANKFGPKHPRMIELNSGIEQIERDITTEVAQLRTTIKADMDRAMAVENATQATLESQKQQAIALNEKAIEYEILKRQAESDQNLYELLLKETKEISLATLMDPTISRIVDQAERPFFPVKPRILLYMMLALVFGLFMGTGLAFFVEYMDSTLKFPNDISRRLKIQMVGMLPYDRSLKKRKLIPLLAETGHSAPENKSGNPYALWDISSQLPTSLKLMDHNGRGQIVLVESAAMGEGKTTVLSKLAVDMASSGLRVLMIDCDLQRPTLHHLFGINNEGGLSEAFAKIMSCIPKAGNLENTSVDDLFFLISLQKLSGQLSVTNEGQTIVTLFQNGRLIQIQNSHNPPNNLLGTMLLKGGFITEGQLEESLERNKRTGQPLGYILLNAGYISQEKLRGPLRLQTEEHLQKLFSWKQEHFTFTPGWVETYQSERIVFGDDFTSTIRQLGKTGGSRLLEKEILAKVISWQDGRIHILPAGNAAPQTGGRINLMLLSKFLDILKCRFDILLVDTPPLLDASGAVPLSSLADGVVLVIKAGHLSVKLVNEAMDKIPNEKIMGAILNQVRVGRDNYYYRYAQRASR